MVSEELSLIGEYVKRDELDYEEANCLAFLLIKWMYEQGMLD